MKRQLSILWVCLLCCLCSCVSKKKYLALEEARSKLETQNIYQYKTIDTLRVEIQSKNNEINSLQQDTARLRGSLLRTRNELEKVQNYLSSSKKELNERIRELQKRDTLITYFKQYSLSYQDSLEILRKEAEFMFGLLIAEDSSYKNVHLFVTKQKMLIDTPEAFFFTPNNRNFISPKGKEVLKMVSQLYQKYPTTHLDIQQPINTDASASSLKESMDRGSMRTAAIARSLTLEHQIPADKVHCGLRMTKNEESHPNRMLIYFSFDEQAILDAIKKL